MKRVCWRRLSMIQCVCHNQRADEAGAEMGLALLSGVWFWGQVRICEELGRIPCAGTVLWNKSFLCLMREWEHQLPGSGLIKQEKGLLKVNHPVLGNLPKFSPSVWLLKQWVKRLESKILVWGWVVFHTQLTVWVKGNSAPQMASVSLCTRQQAVVEVRQFLLHFHARRGECFFLY